LKLDVPAVLVTQLYVLEAQSYVWFAGPQPGSS